MPNFAFSAPVSPSNVEIELVPHKGTRVSRGLPIEVDLGQDVVLVNGVWSGYVARQPEARILLLHSQLPEDLLLAIQKGVDAARAEKGLDPTAAIVQTTELQDNNVVVEEPESLNDEVL